jgi:hypothetical protein
MLYLSSRDRRLIPIPVSVFVFVVVVLLCWMLLIDFMMYDLSGRLRVWHRYMRLRSRVRRGERERDRERGSTFGDIDRDLDRCRLRFSSL